METSRKLEVLTTSRKKTLNFYNKYKNFDFEDINEMLKDLFENILNNISGEMTNSVTKYLILMMKDNKTELSSLKNDLDSIKNNILLRLCQEELIKK
jgi:sulfite reductase alpha subunit-like flavoprotein